MTQDNQPIPTRTFAVGRLTITFALKPRAVPDVIPIDESPSGIIYPSSNVLTAPTNGALLVQPASEAMVESPAVPAPKIFGQDRAMIGRSVSWAAIGCMAISSFGFRWVPGQMFTIPTVALGWAALSAVLLLVALWLIRPKFVAFDVAPRAIRPQTARIQWRLAIVSAVALFVVGDNGQNRILPGLLLPVDIQMALLVFGILGLCRAFGAFRFSLNGLRTFNLKTFDVKKLNRTTVILIGITVLGFGLRLWQLDDTVRIMIDEESDYHAINVLNDQPNTPIFQPLMYGPANYSYVYPYLTRITSALPVGFDLTGPRLGSVLLGGLTIPAVYLLGAALFDDVTGLIAAALMAVFPVAVHFSRLAIPNITDPLFGTLAIAFLARGFRRNSQVDFVLAGACAALSGYFYEGGRFVFLGAFVLFVLLVLVMRRPWWQRRGLILMTMTALCIALPYYLSLTNYQFAPRVESEVVRPKYILRDLQTMPAKDVFIAYWNDALSKTIFHTIYSPDSSRFYYGGNTGILLWYMVPFYLFGLFLVLWRFRYTRWVLWGWLVASMLGISFIVSTDWTARFMLMFPAMVLAVAVGLRYGVELVWPPQLTDRRLKLGAMIVIVAVLGVAQVVYYFHDHLPIYNQQIRFLPDFYDAFERARAYSPSNIVYITDKDVFTQVLDTMFEFDRLNLHYVVWKPNQLTPDKLQTLPRDQPIVFALSPDDQVTPGFLQTNFGVQALPPSPYPTVPLEFQYALYLYKPQ